MEINLLVQDKDTAIEKALGLDRGTLIRECSKYYLGKIKGESVLIHFRKVVHGKILLQEIRTTTDIYEQLKLVEELDKWIDVLFELNHLPPDRIEKLHYEKWVLSLGDLKIEIPFTATTYNEFRNALENIRDDI